MASRPIVPSANEGSILLAGLTSLGLAAWAVTTHFRLDMTINWLPPIDPLYISSVPVWAALIVLSVQMLLLVSSAVTAITQQGMGILDMLMSVANFVVTVVLITLEVTRVLHPSNNLAIGLAAFLLVNTVEMTSTFVIWNVVNRRPGGAIGGAVVERHQ